MKEKMYESKFLPSVFFADKEDVKDYDNIIEKFLSDKDAQQEFHNVRYASHYAALRAIEINEFHFHLNGPYSEALISACENIVEILEDDACEGCYRNTLNFLYLKIYNLL